MEMSVANGSIPAEDVSTIFSTLMTPFPFKENSKINTQEFLVASQGVVMLIDKLGKVFAPVRYDMNGNILKLSQKYDEDTAKYFYLEDMVLAEQQDGENLATDALQWLRRGLHFMLRFFECILADVEEKNNLAGFMKVAYAETLEPYHGWMGSQLFNIISRFSPNRTDFFYTLALDRHNKTEHVLRDLEIFLGSLSKCITQLVDFYSEYNLETHVRV